MYDYTSRILLLFIAILFSQRIYAQKTFYAKITLAQDIIPERISYHYFDGKNDFISTDTFKRHTIVIRGNFFSEQVPLYIRYAGSKPNYVGFFISGKPAKISLHLSPEKQLECTARTNATRVFDTTKQVCKDIYYHKKAIGGKISAFMKKHARDIVQNDSLHHILGKLYKSLNDVTLSRIRRYPLNFYSFWVFREQVVKPSFNILSNDTSYFKDLLYYFKSVFPPKYTNSIAGRTLITQLKSAISPPKSNESAPLFTMKDIHDNIVNLKRYRGKYVLLDFWATWCAPCMREIPVIKKIRENNSVDKLAIIGISWDHNLNSLEKTVQEDSLNWIHIFDREAQIITLYGIHSIPQLFLINKKGVIVYKSINGDEQELLDILKETVQ